MSDEKTPQYQQNSVAVRSKNPALYLLPVPISDAPVDCALPAANLEVVRSLRYFVVENLRSARRFLKRVDRTIDIDTLHFTELNEHTPAADVAAMLDPMTAGYSIGVLSEAGCPAVADPGSDLVAVAQSRGCRVVPMVGPSSIILSLMASGFNGQSFAFNGYLPVEAKARQAKMRQMEHSIRGGQTQIFIETPYRNNKLIESLVASLPAALKLCVACDITGPGESIITRPLARWRTAKYDYSKIPCIFLLYV